MGRRLAGIAIAEKALKDLTAGEEYTVQVRYYTGYSPYSLRFCRQKAHTAISSESILHDIVQFTDQRNVHNFAVPENGAYYILICEMESSCRVDLYAFDYLGEAAKYVVYAESGQCLTLENLQAGETYEIQVCQNCNYSDYTYGDHGKITVIKPTKGFVPNG